MQAGEAHFNKQACNPTGLPILGSGISFVNASELTETPEVFVTGKVVFFSCVTHKRTETGNFGNIAIPRHMARRDVKQTCSHRDCGPCGAVGSGFDRRDKKE